MNHSCCIVIKGNWLSNRQEMYLTTEGIGYIHVLYIIYIFYWFLKVNFHQFINFSYKTQSNLSMWSPLFSSHLYLKVIFLAHLAKGHVSFCHHLASGVVRRKLSHLNLLLWNCWTKLNQTWQGWSLGGSLSKLCPTALPSIQDGCCY